MHVVHSRADLDEPRLYKDKKSPMGLNTAIRALSRAPVSLLWRVLVSSTLQYSLPQLLYYALADWASSTRSHPMATTRTRTGQQRVSMPVDGRSGQATPGRN